MKEEDLYKMKKEDLSDAIAEGIAKREAAKVKTMLDIVMVVLGAFCVLVFLIDHPLEEITDHLKNPKSFLLNQVDKASQKLGIEIPPSE